LKTFSTRKMFRRKLQALKYTGWNKFDITNEVMRHEAVNMLESMYIRELPLAERVGLKAKVSPQWIQFFNNYLDALGSPISLSPAQPKEEWVQIFGLLLNEAISCMYSDKKDHYNRLQPKKRRVFSSKKLEGTQTVAFRSQLVEICKFLKIPHNENVQITMQCIHTIVRTKFSRAAISNYAQKVSNNSKDVSDRIRSFRDIVRHYDLGFKTTDGQLDAACTVLRMLYIRDLAEYQAQGTEMILKLQQFSANPKTNSRLGKVGR